MTNEELKARLGTALEHASHAIRAMEKEGSWTVNDWFFPPDTVGRDVGSAEYHVAAMTRCISNILNEVKDS